MNGQSRLRSVMRLLAAGAGFGAGAYGVHIGLTWSRYGRAPQATADEADALLDRFMPAYDVVERHHISVAAPAAVVLAAAQELDLLRSPLVRAIFRVRELVLGATPDIGPRPRGLLAQMQSLGWGVLAEVPGHEIVVAAVTRPWEPNVTFRALPPEDFEAFHEPGYVKIAWTLRADPVSGTESIFRTETRAIATDAAARTRFRRYWALFSPGIAIIRSMSLSPVRQDAERLARDGRPLRALEPH